MFAFKQIDNMVMKERSKAEGSLWTNMTMIIEPDGKMHVDFDYTDLSENAYKYSKQWKKAYLV